MLASFPADVTLTFAVRDPRSYIMGAWTCQYEKGIVDEKSPDVEVR